MEHTFRDLPISLVLPYIDLFDVCLVIDEFQTFQGCPPFSKTKDFLSLLKFKDFFKADLEFKATAGTLR